MTGLRFRTFATAAMLALGTAQWASAGPIDLTIGDNDGFGFGAALVPDGSPLLHDILPDTVADAALSNRRSVAEAAATNGAQQTDIYSAIKNFALQPLPETFDLVFPFIGELTSGVFSVDMAGFEADLFGQIGVSFNGVAQTKSSTSPTASLPRPYVRLRWAAPHSRTPTWRSSSSSPSHVT